MWGDLMVMQHHVFRTGSRTAVEVRGEVGVLVPIAARLLFLFSDLLHMWEANVEVLGDAITVRYTVSACENVSTRQWIMMCRNGGE